MELKTTSPYTDSDYTGKSFYTHNSSMSEASTMSASEIREALFSAVSRKNMRAFQQLLQKVDLNGYLPIREDQEAQISLAASLLSELIGAGMEGFEPFILEILKQRPNLDLPCIDENGNPALSLYQTAQIMQQLYTREIESLKRAQVEQSDLDPVWAKERLYQMEIQLRQTELVLNYCEKERLNQWQSQVRRLRQAAAHR